MWVYEVSMKRREFGEFHHLMKQLRQDEFKFKEYFRMSSNEFEQLLSLIKDDIEKKEVNYRETSSAEERLALCFRYVGGPKRNRKRSLVGGPVVVHASAARCPFRGPFCISLPTGIVE